MEQDEEQHRNVSCLEHFPRSVYIVSRRARVINAEARNESRRSSRQSGELKAASVFKGTGRGDERESARRLAQPGVFPLAKHAR